MATQPPTPTPSTDQQPVSTAMAAAIWAQVAGNLATVILSLTGHVEIAALIPVFEKMFGAATAALEAAKGTPITPETVDALRPSVALLPPTS